MTGRRFGLGGDGLPIDDGPEIDDISPRAAKPGKAVTITGSNFLDGSDGKLTFTSAAPNATPVEPSRTWSDTEISTVFPNLGAGGLVSVTVARERRKATDIMTAWEPNAPTVSVDPAEGTADRDVTLRGQYFGYGGSARRQPPETRVTVDGTAIPAKTWDRTEIVVHLPALAGGKHTLTVDTPWGKASAEYVSHPVPQVKPMGAVLPGGLATIRGSGFGEARGTVLVGDPASPQAAEISSWHEAEIVVRIPGRLRLTWGLATTQLTVRLPWAQATTTVKVGWRPSVTTWARIEPHQRIDRLEDGLRLGLQARVHDAAWLLACQWRLREYELEDSGSPISVAVEAEAYPVARWSASGKPATPLTGSAPLETIVEREPRSDEGGAVRWNARLSAEAGMQFSRMIGARIPNQQRIQKYRADYLKRYPLKGAKAPDAPTQRFLDLMGNRVIDGAQLHVALRSARPGPGVTPKLAAEPQIQAVDRPAMLKLVAAWYGWCDTLLNEGRPSDATWDPARLEYRFSVSADTPVAETALAAREYDGGRLDWHDFEIDRSTALRGTAKAVPPVPIRASMIPAPVRYPGMPAERWWQFEDARVDFGEVDAAPSDLARLLLVEFATVYGNDWFVVPLTGVPAGSLTHLTKVTVTNTFGDALQVGPLRRAPEAQDLHLFELTAIGKTPEKALEAFDLLFVPATVPPGLESPPVERVDFVRDESANMAWGVESVVESGVGAPRDRAEGYVPNRSAPPDGAPIAPIAYRLRTDVPRYWIPFVPETHDGKAWLHRVGMPDSNGKPIPPQGRILKGGDLFIYDEEIPREGAQVTRSYQYARGVDGATYLWLGRRRRPGALRTSSGLRFDSVDPTQ